MACLGFRGVESACTAGTLLTALKGLMTEGTGNREQGQVHRLGVSVAVWLREPIFSGTLVAQTNSHCEDCNGEPTLFPLVSPDSDFSVRHCNSACGGQAARHVALSVACSHPGVRHRTCVWKGEPYRWPVGSWFRLLLPMSHPLYDFGRESGLRCEVDYAG